MIYCIIGTFVIGFLCGLAGAGWIREWKEDRKFFKWLDEQEKEQRKFFNKQP